jgi:hypothetical protein
VAKNKREFGNFLAGVSQGGGSVNRPASLGEDEYLAPNPMSRLFRLPGSVKRDPAIEGWMRERSGELGAIAQHWFEVMRECGDDVRELLHDGHPTACVGDAAFGYVNAFTAHVNVGFFRGAEIADPESLLEGSGKFMRHVKLRPERDVAGAALKELIETAYADMRQRVELEGR